MQSIATGVSLVSDGEFVNAIKSAQSVDLSSFLLEDGPVLDALKSAAKGGADVHVTLAGDHFARSIEDIREANRHAASVVRHAGGQVDFNDGRQHPQTPLHAKLALIDGTAYLNERNWPSKMDTILRDENPADIEIVKQGLAQQAASNDHLSVHKATSLTLESDVLREAPGHEIAVQTESFGPGQIADAMKARAEAGDHVRFIMVKSDVKKSAQAALDELQQVGVDVRLNPQMGSEKMALVGENAWVGSSNATKGRPDQVDWGMTTDDSDIIAQLKEHFEQTWSKSEPALVG